MVGVGISAGGLGIGSGGGSSTPVTIDGFEIGHVGGNGTEYTGLDLSGFKLAAGDDFTSNFTWWHPVRKPQGRYTSTYWNNGRHRAGTEPESFWIDSYYRGPRSAEPADLGVTRHTVADSILTLTADLPEPEIYDALPDDFTFGDASDKPLLVASSLMSNPSFMFSAQADWVLMGRILLPSGYARSFHPGVWTSNPFWPDKGEIEIFEGLKTANTSAVSKFNIIASETDGAGATFVTVAQPTITQDSYITYVFRKVGGTIYFYDDIATPGTLAQRGTTTQLVDRLLGAHDVRMTLNANESWDSTTFTEGDWPFSLKLDWWQAWVPSDAGDNTPMEILDPVLTTPGGSWATTLPAAATISGGAAGAEEFYGVFYNSDAPGAGTKSSTTKLPGGMSIDAGTRAVTGTVPATEGGWVGVMIAFAYDDGTPAKRVMLPFHVAPAVQNLFTGLNMAYAEALDQDIVPTDFHSGDLGPHTYSVALTGGSWITVTGNGTNTVNLSGTAPSSDETVTVEITCTNSVGQTTVVERDIVVAAVGGLVDTFTDASATWLTAHTPDTGEAWQSVTGTAGSLAINVNNKVAPTNAVQQVRNLTTFNADHSIEFTITYQGSTNNAMGVVFRSTGTTAWYFLNYDQNDQTWKLQRRVASVSTTIATLARAPGSGTSETVKIEVYNASGNVQIDVYFDGVLNATLTTTDSSGAQILTAGDFALRGYKLGAAAVTFDNLTVVNL